MLLLLLLLLLLLYQILDRNFGLRRRVTERFEIRCFDSGLGGRTALAPPKI